MNSITESFNSIKAIYLQNKKYADYIAKIAIVFFVFLSVLKSDYTYSRFPMLSSIFVASLMSALLSIICVALDVRVFMFLFSVCVYVSLSSNVGLALVTLILFLVLFILFGSISQESAFIIMLTICMSYLKVPYLVPVYLGLNKNKRSVLPVLIGFFMFFFVKGANTCILFNQGLMQDNILNQILYGLTYIANFMLINSTFVISCITSFIVILLLNFIKYFYIEKGKEISIIVSYVIFLVTFIINNSMINTGDSTFAIIFFIVVSMMISYFLYVIEDGCYNYKDTQRVFFKDDNSVYYVKIVPRGK